MPIYKNEGDILDCTNSELLSSWLMSHAMKLLVWWLITNKGVIERY